MDGILVIELKQDPLDLELILLYEWAGYMDTFCYGLSIICGMTPFLSWTVVVKSKINIYVW